MAEPVTHAEGVPAQVVLDLLPDGRVLITATCGGKPDARYAAMQAHRVPAEVGKLLAELRSRAISLRASR